MEKATLDLPCNFVLHLLNQRQSTLNPFDCSPGPAVYQCIQLGSELLFVSAVLWRVSAESRETVQHEHVKEIHIKVV